VTLKDNRVGFIGCGKVGRTLARALARSGYDVCAAFSRGGAAVDSFVGEVPSARRYADAQRLVDDCDFVWLTVADDAIGPVADSLRWSSRHKVVHCSGATEIEVLRKVVQDGGTIGGFHPLQMFTNPQVALKGLPGCTVGIEAQGIFRGELEQLALQLRCTPFRIPPGTRALYHASAYYVGPFLIALLSEAATLWHAFGATERQALDALLPLLSGTVAAVQDAGLARGMGGCVARGDVGTVQRHLQALGGFDPAMQDRYRQLALRTVPLGIERGTLPPDVAARIEEILQSRHGSAET